MTRAIQVAWFCVAVFGFAFSPAAPAGIREEFAYSLPLQVPPGAPVARIDVPLAVYRDSVDPELRDIRVLNGAGEVVPFSLRRPEAARRASPTVLYLQLFPLRGEAAISGTALRLRIDAGKTSIEVEGAPPAAEETPVSGYLVNATGVDNAIESLQFEWPEATPDFALNVVIAASDDLVQWREIAPRAPLARLRHAGATFEQRSVSFPATRATYWRVTSGTADPLPAITAAAATLVSASVPVERLITEVKGLSLRPLQGWQVFEFDLGAKLPVDRVELVLPDVNTVATAQFFARTQGQVWQILADQSVYRMQTANGELVSPPIEMFTAPARQWRVHVAASGGGIGGGVPSLRVGWLADQLVFVTRGAGPFEVVYGNAQAPGAAVPFDDLFPGDAQFARLTGGDIPLASAGESREVGGPSRLEPPPPPTPWRRWILWLALIAGVAVLGAVAFNLSRQLRQDEAR
jgi:Protein of unknown function (DUF3999)